MSLKHNFERMGFQTMKVAIASQGSINVAIKDPK